MAPAITSDRSTRDMGDSNEVLNRMFSSFLTRKNRGTSSAEPLPRLSLNLPRLNVPVRQPSINHPVSAPAPTIRNRDRSKTSSSRQPPRTSSRANGDEHHHDSIAPARTSQESIQAIATDTTTVPTPFHCDRCTKAFRQRSQLSRHYSRVHEKRKPFACAHCSKAFASAFDRKRHVEVSSHPHMQHVQDERSHPWLTIIDDFLPSGCARQEMHRVLLRPLRVQVRRSSGIRGACQDRSRARLLPSLRESL